VTDALRIRSMSKTFDGVTVLHDLDLDIAPGEVHGLVGENGSGKSTFVKILGGLHSPDDGSSASVWDEELSFPVARPQQHGIAIIHQDLALYDGMSVSENIGISSGFDTTMLGLFRRSRERRIVQDLLREFDVDLDPDVLVGGLTPSEQSVVAILRGLRLLRKHQSHQVLILDEPTAALSQAESQKLLSIIRGLAARGTAILFIGHRLQEVLSVCDRVSVLRSGRLVATVEARATSDTDLVTMMLGYELGAFYPDRHLPDREREVLSVSGLSGGSISDLDLTTYRGEVLGVTGLAGMGQDEVGYLLVGHGRRTSGTVSIGGVEVHASVGQARRAGLVLVPGNRQRDSVWMEGTAVENLTIPFLDRFAPRQLLNGRKEKGFAAAEMRRFDVRPMQPAQHVSRFSGGNQQKLVLARWLQTHPKVLLLHEPTQGVDAGAKKEIFELIRAASDEGLSVIIFSSDIEEIVNVCHRVLILDHGSVVAEIPQHQLSEDTVLAASQGNYQLHEQR